MVDRTTRRKVARLALAGSMVLPALAVVATAAGAGTSDRVYAERQWKAIPDATNVQNVRLALDSAHRVAYTFTPAKDGIAVRAHGLDDLKQRGAPLVDSGVAQPRTVTPIAVDETHGVVVYAPPAGDDLAVPLVRVYGATPSGVARLGIPKTRFPAGYAVAGMAVDAPRGRLFVLGAPHLHSQVKNAGPGAGQVMLDTWRLSDLAAGRVGSDAAAPLTVPAACGQLVTRFFQAGILPAADGKSVYFGCMGSKVTSGPVIGEVAGVARLDLAAAAAGESTALRIAPISGNYKDGDSFALPGAQRFALAAGNAGVVAVKIYDAATGYYVGNVGLDSSLRGVGFDTRRGRAYYVNTAGFGLFDAGRTPVNQGVLYPEYAPVFGGLLRVLESDEKTRRVFVATAGDLVNGADPYIMVLKDPTPVTSGLPEETDGEGLDVAEVPGKYEGSWGVDAGAVGAEYRMVGGPTNLLFNASGVDTRGIVTRPGTRTLHNAAVRSLRLTRNEAAVGAVTVRYDDVTATDADSTHLSEPVECTDFGGDAKETTRSDVAVTCDVDKERATARVAADPPRVVIARTGEASAEQGGPAPADPVPAPIHVRHAQSTVESFRDKDGSFVTRLHSEATGIDILGTVQIGRVAADAEVRLKGRSGSASTVYDRQVQGLVINGQKVCDKCPVDQAGAAIEEALNGRALVYLPEPTRYASAQGRRAYVRDDLHRHYQRTTFDEVPDDVFVTPAMEVVVFLDATASSRLIASFASVSAQGRYTIQQVSPDGELPPAPPTIEPDPPAGPVTTPGTGGDVVSDPAKPIVDTKPIAAPAFQGNVVQRLTEGLKVVFRSPRHLASVAALWSLLALPTYLAARRRLLLDLPFMRTVEES